MFIVLKCTANYVQSFLSLFFRNLNLILYKYKGKITKHPYINLSEYTF